MNSAYFWIKWLHVVSSTVLLGTGAGIAFFLWRAQKTKNAHVMAAVAREVVLADLVFTAVAVIVQPVTGLMLMRLTGYTAALTWIRWSLVLFVLVGACWLPVVWLQLKMRDLAVAAVRRDMPLPKAYFSYLRWWKALGWPAFAGVLIIVWLMIAKPA